MTWENHQIILSNVKKLAVFERKTLIFQANVQYTYGKRRNNVI